MDIINENNEVVGRTTKSDIYAQSLPHRIAHVLVFNDTQQLALARRAAHLSYCPNHWCSTAGGHVSAGEDYETAALRELREEAGVVLPLTPLGTDWYSSTDQRALRKAIGSFNAAYNGNFSPNPDEVAEIQWLDLPVIQQMIKSGEPFHPELLFILRQYYQINS